METSCDNRMKNMKRCLLKGRLIFIANLLLEFSSKILMQTASKSCRMKKPVAEVKSWAKDLISIVSFSICLADNIPALYIVFFTSCAL